MTFEMSGAAWLFRERVAVRVSVALYFLYDGVRPTHTSMGSRTVA